MGSEIINEQNAVFIRGGCDAEAVEKAVMQYWETYHKNPEWIMFSKTCWESFSSSYGGNGIVGVEYEPGPGFHAIKVGVLDE